MKAIYVSKENREKLKEIKAHKMWASISDVLNMMMVECKVVHGTHGTKIMDDMKQIKVREGTYIKINEIVAEGLKTPNDLIDFYLENWDWEVKK